MKKLFVILGAAFALMANLGAQTTISPGRAIEIQIKGVPQEEIVQINGTYPVSDSGLINMPHIGTVRAAGLSPIQLAQNIQNAYRSAQIYRNPTIQVLASSDDTVTKHFVTIGGQVKRPGPVDYMRGMTLYQALQAGGGATEFGSMYRVRLIRAGKQREYDLTQTQFKNIPVQPSDTIEVPQKNIIGR